MNKKEALEWFSQKK